MDGAVYENERMRTGKNGKPREMEEAIMLAA